jgi:hypothetical protein
MPRSLIALALMLALAACGGSADSTAPSNTPRVARIGYATDAALVFTGTTVPAEALVQAYDADGAQLSDTLLRFVLPPGWTLARDSITAPSFEAAGGLVAYPRAGYAAARALADAAPGDSTAVTAASDLRHYDWIWTWTCADTAPPYLLMGDRVDSVTRQPIYLDSVHYALAPDTIVYPGDTAATDAATWMDTYVHNSGGVAQTWMHGTIIQYYRDGIADTLIDAGGFATIDHQAPDTLFLALDKPDQRPPIVRGTGADSLTWTGSATTLCQWQWQRASAVVMRATPRQ